MRISLAFPLLTFFSCTLSAPTKSGHPLPGGLLQRNSDAKDGLYFVNCANQRDGTISSGVAYYTNMVHGENNGQQPVDYEDVTHGSYYTWEQTGSIQFSDSGVVVHWNIESDAQNIGENQSVGRADNTYENWAVWKDDGGFLYSIDDWNCNSIYYAQ